MRRLAHLETLIEAYPEHPRVVEAHARMGMIHRHHHGDPVRAGMRWVAAASIDPGHEMAGRWMLDAGLAFADAGDIENALSALDVACQPGLTKRWQHGWRKEDCSCSAILHRRMRITTLLFVQAQKAKPADWLIWAWPRPGIFGPTGSCVGRVGRSGRRW